ncbi:hypothetical protein [Actinoplanes sp. N902-109]|uniref:hypothetical protein n=1 Tax=Actinoplanes sp. (strain N902-109) TaxID=649831 RepID=UPI0012F9D999|nr:hypothetical protein [Actinoplanes sp. N902-109]
MIVRVMRAGAVVTVLAVAGCSAVDDGGRDWNPDHQPGYVLPGDNNPAPTATWPGEGSGLGLPGLGQADPSEPDHVAHGGSGYVDAPATFQLVNPADVVRVKLADLNGDLYSVSTPAQSKSIPVASVDHNNVAAGLRDSGLGGPALVTVVLAKDVRWRVRLSGGASDETVDLSAGSAGGDVDLSAGVTRAEVFLPAAAGTQRVILSGGASQLVVHLAGTAPARVAAGNGAGTVTIDGQSQSGVAGGTVFAPPSWDTAPNRFDIAATAGVSDLTVAHS